VTEDDDYCLNLQWLLHRKDDIVNQFRFSPRKPKLPTRMVQQCPEKERELVFRHTQ